MKRRNRSVLGALVVALVFGTQCNGTGENDELAMLDSAPASDIEHDSSEGKEDGMGSLGPQVGGHSDTAVWTVTNQWEDRDPAAGLAWDASSGLSWEEKYALWVASLERISGSSGYDTFQITNPWGVTLEAPVLECAETAYFLRATFAAWYGLPFYVQARDSQGSIYLGHFGFIRRDGSRYNNSPRYSRLADHSGDYPHGSAPSTWPSDSRLRGKGLYGGGDEVPFLGDDARAGAYFDELYLNKRVGYFMLTLLGYFGSIHLADTTITFHLQPEAVQPGDVLIERWQRRGIGHTIPVMSVAEVVEGRFEVAVSSGSMPRRQPVWEEPAAARRYFTNDMMGGHGTSSDGEPYAALGGGLRRWRIAAVSSGRWRNTVSADSREFWINSSDLDSIAARVDRFAEILATVSPEEQREVLLEIIQGKREHLSRYPASCAARIAREEAFEALYELSQDEWGQSVAQVDAAHRTLADYVFAPLVYDQSRTCCWNSSNADMYRIVMDYNRSLQESGCQQPLVFMMRDGDYGIFENYADAQGEGDLWRAWSADESCPQQSTVTTDTEAEHLWTPFCDLADVDDTDPVPPDDCEDGDDSSVTATALELDAAPYSARICAGDEDFYRFTTPGAGDLTVTVSFRHDEGDLDTELFDSSGARLRNSNSTTDTEEMAVHVDAGGDFTARVYGYSGAQASYTIVVTFVPDTTGGGDTGDGNDSRDSATPVSAGSSTPAAIDVSGDEDFYRVDVGSVRATISFTHATGDLDMELLDGSGAQLDQSQGTSDTETVDGSGTSPMFIRVYGYSSATGAYTLTID